MFSLKLQELIHRFEVGAGARAVRALVLVCAFLGVALFYDTLCFRNFNTEEAMDTAQLARNIARGEGFTTKVIRPFSMFLISRQRADRDPLIKERHPDVVNAPVYPALLAGVMKLAPAQDMLVRRYFSIAWGDLAVGVFNQLLLLIAIVLVYRLARRWFDRTVAIVAAVVFGLTEAYWRFSLSGLSTDLLIVLLLLLVWCLSRIEELGRTSGSTGRSIGLAFGAGLLLVTIGLTRYSCAFLIVPAVAFIAISGVPRRGLMTAVMVLVFVVGLAPWVARNWMLTGAPFGVATYAPMEMTRTFPEDRLQRSLHPDLALLHVPEYTRKLVVNTREVVTNDLPRMGGNWLWSFFLVGLLLRFRNPAISRMRWFAVIAILTFIPVQALVRTQNWTASPDFNSENLLIVLSPLVLVLGVGVFFVLLDSLELSSMTTRYAASAGFVVIISLPLLLTAIPPRPDPVAYPPYFPPYFQQVGRWLSRHELAMSDVPAALAWYGDVQTVSATLSWKDDFNEIHDFQKPIKALYLTTVTTERKFLGRWMRGQKENWAAFVFDVMAKQEVPTGFPLKQAHRDFHRDGQVFLMDHARWISAEKNM